MLVLTCVSFRAHSLLNTSTPGFAQDCEGAELPFTPWQYHAMPYADRGFFRWEVDTEDTIERCSPAPRGDLVNGKAGACEGGIELEEDPDAVDCAEFPQLCG